MRNFFKWIVEIFPPKEFMLRSNSGMKYFRVGTAMQIILISLLITSGCLVALFTYKMQFLQTVNYKQNIALKDLRKKYMGFTKAVVNLRKELILNDTNFSSTDLNVELQVKKITKLLEILENDIAAVNKNKEIKKDAKLHEIKDKLETIITEKKDREKLISELDKIIEKLQYNIDKIYKNSNNNYYIDTTFNTVFYSKEGNQTAIVYRNDGNQVISANLTKTINESIIANTELKMLSYHLAMKKEESKFFFNVNNDLKLSMVDILDKRTKFLENIFNKTKVYNLTKLDRFYLEDRNNIIETLNIDQSEIGGPLVQIDEENTEISNLIYEKSNKFQILRKRFLSVPLSSPLKNYYVTSGYGRRIDPYTKRRAFHKGIDLGAPWGSDILVTAKGKVSFVGRYGSYGKSVFVDHGYGLQTRYAHLSKIFVKQGQDLELGESLGKIGNTGRSTGKHLHYEIKVNDKARNPYPFLKIGKNVFKKL